MRKKAERQIRHAADSLGDSGTQSIHQVRKRAGLIRKVYDKTLLDMARLGTIELIQGDTGTMDAEAMGNAIHHLGRCYVRFRFLATKDTAVETVPETVEVTLRNMDRDAWQRFDYYCRTRENSDPHRKIVEMIRAYNQERE